MLCLWKFDGEREHRMDVEVTDLPNKEEIYKFVMSLPKHKMGGNDLGGIRIWFYGGMSMQGTDKK